MKNISIVYKRSTTYDEFYDKKDGKVSMRRTINNFYSSTVQKNKNKQKQDEIQYERIQTSKNYRQSFRSNVISSLSIIPVPTPPPSSIVKNLTEKKVSLTTASNIFSITKPRKLEYVTVKLPAEDYAEHVNHFSLRKSLKQFSMHSRLKLLSKIKCQMEITIILSIDFIYNQFNFWAEEQIQQNCLRTWKILMSLANIIWLVRSEAAHRKLISFTQNRSLRLDGVIQIDYCKKQTLTISYAALQQQIKFKRSNKILIIQALRNKTNQKMHEFEFRNSLPIISHPSTFVHFVRIDMSNKKRINVLKKIISKDTPKPFNLHEIIQQYKQKKDKNNLQIKWKQNNSKQTQLVIQAPIDVVQQIQKMKQKMLREFEQTFGLKTKIQGDSISYVVGDMLKRNLKLIKQYYSYYEQYNSKPKIPEKPILEKTKKFQFGRPIYIWDS